MPKRVNPKPMFHSYWLSSMYLSLAIPFINVENLVTYGIGLTAGPLPVKPQDAVPKAS